MSNLLSILTVTKDRTELFAEFVENMQAYPFFEWVDWIIVDNSDIDTFMRKRALVPKQYTNVKVLSAPDFVSARNRSVDEVKTPYFTILDDDDQLVQEFYTVFETALHTVIDPDFISFNDEKLSRYVPKLGLTLDLNYHLVKDKLNWLNNFTNYKDDKHSKVYCCNGINIYKTQTWRDLGLRYVSPLADDIAPVTLMYLQSKNVYKIPYITYVYPDQNTVSSKKSEEKLRELESCILSQYQLIRQRIKGDYELVSVLKRAVHNSIDQLLHIDRYVPTDLLKFFVKL